MPVLESTDKITPKSVLRHRPIGGGKRSKITSAAQPVAQRASRTRPVEANEEAAAWQDKTAKAEKQTKIKRTAAITKALLPTTLLTNKRSWPCTIHPLVYLGSGMAVMLIIWTLLSMTFGWFTLFIDDLHYGRPRTFQMDAWVGHNEQNGNPSHFVAINLNRHIEIIEISGDDPLHTHIYSGPQLYGISDDLVPVTLSFVDVNGDHKADMLISFQGSQVVFINDGESFRPLLPSERRSVDQFLQQHVEQ